MSGMRGPAVREGQVYVGNLPPNIKTRDIEDIFYKFGKINFVNLKNGTGPIGPGPPFAFVEFEDPRDANDAIKERDGYSYKGYALRVELPRGISGNRPRTSGGRSSFGDRSHGDGGSYGSSRGGAGSDYGVSRRSPRRGSPPPRRASPIRSSRSDNRIIITGLPKSAVKQDLKEHLRAAGEIGHIEIVGDGTGSVEFASYEDMKYAVKNMDDTKFKTQDGDVSYIRIKENYGSKDKDARARSRSPGRRSSRGSPKMSPPPRR